VILRGGEGGLFGGSADPVEMVADSLARAEGDENVRAVILVVNSPGGSIGASDEIHHEIVEFKKRTGKPVIAYMQDLAASGGYYISAPADEIVANRTTLTGSIGVIIQGFNFHGTLTEIVKGQDATIKAGGNKSMGSMFADPKSEEAVEGRKLLQELCDYWHGQFKQVVRDGRGKRLVAEWETFADGRVVSAEQARKIGLVDKIGYFDTAVDAAKAKAGIGNAEIVEYSRPVGLAALFGANAQDAKPSVEQLKALEKAGPELAAEAMSERLQRELRLYPGKPMALWVP
jgi:protease-4